MQISKREITKFRNSYTNTDSADIITDEVALAVLFDEKDDVKRLGAKWNPDPSGKGGHWSMKTNRLEKDCTIECDLMGEGWGGTILDWLNNHKMVYKQAGNIRLELTKGLKDADSCHWLETIPDMHGLGGHRVQFETFTLNEAVTVIKFIDPEVGAESWLLPEDAKTIWENLVAGGYNASTAQPTESA